MAVIGRPCPPPSVGSAHRKLDAAVLDADGREPGLTDDEILDRLLALNLGRPAVGDAVVLVEADAQEADDGRAPRLP